MTNAELQSLANKRARAYTKKLFTDEVLPVKKTGKRILRKISLTEGPVSSVEACHVIEVSSATMDIRTIKRRVARFLDSSDYTITKTRNGRHIYNISAEMLGWITDRHY